MRRGLRSTTMIFAQSQSFVGSRPDCAGAKFALELEFVGVDAKPKVHRRVLMLLPRLLLLLPSRAEPPIMVRNLRRRRRNPPPPARLESVSASPILPSRRFTSGVPTRSSSHGEDAGLDKPSSGDGRAPGGRTRSTCNGRRPFFRERRRPGKGGVMSAARRQFGLTDS